MPSPPCKIGGFYGLWKTFNILYVNTIDKIDKVEYNRVIPLKKG